MPSALASRTPCPSATPPTATPTTAMGQVCSLRRWRRSVLLYDGGDRKSTRLNSSHSQISYAVFCLKQKSKQLISANSHNPHAVIGVETQQYIAESNARHCAPATMRSTVTDSCQHFLETHHTHPHLT